MIKMFFIVKIIKDISLKINEILKKGVSILQVFLTEENKLDYHQILF